VLEDGVVEGRIFLMPIGPTGQPWMWTSGHNGSDRARGARLRTDTRGCAGGVHQELATSVGPPCHWRGRWRSNGAATGSNVRNSFCPDNCPGSRRNRGDGRI